MIVKQEILMREIIRLLDDTKEVIIRAKGRSMHPYIRDGVDSLVIAKADTSLLHNGEVILAKTTDNNYVMHRIIKIDESGITLKGDGNLFGTERCSRSDVIGILTHVEKGGKRIDCNTKKERLKAYVMRSTWRAYHKAKHYLRRLLKGKP